MSRQPLQCECVPRKPAGWQLLVLLMAALLAGCSEEQLNSAYGKRTGLEEADSVNGTRVFANLFSAAGDKVKTRKALSPGLYETNCIVWFPNDFQPPSPEVSHWLENWLVSAPDRTLIYVGRDFDTEPLYWSKVMPLMPANLQAEAARRQGQAQARVGGEQLSRSDTATSDWFSLEKLRKPRPITQLSGPWADGVDPSKVEITLNSKLEPSEWAQILLASGDDILISRYSLDTLGRGELLVVANGAPLLNLGLVNHEHRKLAQRLVDHVGTGQQVVFLESGVGGPKILDREPTQKMPNELEILNVWPVNIILLHFAVVGIIFALGRWPIFGSPRELATTSLADFGQHVDALARMFARTRSRQHALERVAQYHDSRPASKTPAGGHTSRRGR